MPKSGTLLLREAFVALLSILEPSVPETEPSVPETEPSEPTVPSEPAEPEIEQGQPGQGVEED